MKPSRSKRWITSRMGLLLVLVVLASMGAGHKGMSEDLIPPIKVTVNYAEAELSDVLQSLVYGTSLNLIAGKDLAGTVTVHLTNVFLKDALTAILRANGYTLVAEGSVLRVVLLPKEEAIEVQPELSTAISILNYTRADDMKENLKKFLSPEGFIETFTRTNTEDKKIRSDILIIRDVPEIVQHISQIVRELDVETPQVLIEAKFVEIFLSDADKLGINWTIKATLTGNKIPVTLPIPNTIMNRTADLIPRPIPSTTAFPIDKMFPFSAAGDFTFGSLSASEFQAVLQVLEQRGKTNLISAPRVMTLTGEEATMTVGSVVPIPTYERNNTTGTFQVSGYQDQQIGVVLRVTPHVIGGGEILLKFHPEISEITGFTGPNNERPITSTREANTNVVVASGDTVAIGGMIKEKEITTSKLVPVLGRIPFFGAPFRYKEKTFEKTELFIFVTPRIVKARTGSSDGS